MRHRTVGNYLIQQKTPYPNLTLLRYPSGSIRRWRRSVWALLLFATAGAQQPAWVVGPWTRASQEPVISPSPNSVFTDPETGRIVHWEALHTFNPAAVVRNNKIFVLYRAEDDTGQSKIGGHTSRLGLASSEDGVHFTRQPTPVFYPTNDNQRAREAEGGVEDPRIVEDATGRYILTYTQWSRITRVYSIGVATSRDLVHWTKYGPIFGSTGKYASLKYKSSSIVTKNDHGRLIAAMFAGHYWMYWGERTIRVAMSDDLIHWHPIEDSAGNPLVVLRPRPGLSDSDFPEAGPPALITNAGIVLLYNGRNAAGAAGDSLIGGGAYTVQEALFSPQNPSHLLDRTQQPVLQPMLSWEKTGQYQAGTTFAEGLVQYHGSLFLYYGAADSFVGVATAPKPGEPRP